jgi:hypothetical protein
MYPAAANPLAWQSARHHVSKTAKMCTKSLFLTYCKWNFTACRSPGKDFVIYRLQNFATSRTRGQECSRSWTVVGRRARQTDRDRMRFGWAWSCFCTYAHPNYHKKTRHCYLLNLFIVTYTSSIRFRVLFGLLQHQLLWVAQNYL